MENDTRESREAFPVICDLDDLGVHYYEDGPNKVYIVITLGKYTDTDTGIDHKALNITCSVSDNEFGAVMTGLVTGKVLHVVSVSDLMEKLQQAQENIPKE